MSEPEHFLSRWARRKQEVAREESAPDEAKAQKIGTVSEAAPGAANLDAQAENMDGQAGDGEKREEPAFDLSKLPSIESITAETDIRPFLAAGVPASLRQAALRRAWVADPKIRDFIGIAENQWDFTAGGNAPGFDFSPPLGDVKRMVADIFGEKPEVDSQKEAPSQAARLEPDSPAGRPDDAGEAHLNVTETLQTEELGADGKADAPQLENESVRQTLVAQHVDPDAASQKNDAAQESENLLPRPSHGRAMPK